MKKYIAILSKLTLVSRLVEMKRDVIDFSKSTALLTTIVAFFIYFVSKYYPQYGILKTNVWCLVSSSMEVLLMAIIIFSVLRYVTKYH